MKFKKRYLMIPFVIGLLIWLNGIVSDPFSVPFQDYDSMPKEQKQMYEDKSKLIGIHRSVGLAIMGLSTMFVIIVLLLTTEKTISFKVAQNKAQSYIPTYDQPENDKLIITDDTILKEWGWIFFYNTEKYIETNDPKYTIAGNVPLFVTKNGEIFETGTAEPLEGYIERFEKTGNPHG